MFGAADGPRLGKGRRPPRLAVAREAGLATDMGIQGLLPVLKPVIEDAHVREFKGKKLGVDTFAWLHKAAFTCAYELAMNIKTDKYIAFIMNRIKMLRSHGVEPLMVFDGCAMPAKKDTNDERGRLRAQHHARGMAHAQDGNRSAATDCFQAAIRITPQMTRSLQKKLHEAGVQFIVAPYEADVQLAYLSIHGHVDAVVTEDSDLVVYGAKRIFLKMDKHGAGQLFCQSSLSSVESPNIRSFTSAMFMHMCILAGCDMLPSMPGMGIRKAAQLLRDYKSMDRVFAAIRSHSTAFSMPPEYEETFWKCVLTFKHGRAYDPNTQKLCYLTPPPQNWDVDVEHGDDVENVNGHLGPPMSPETARGIATGVLNPRTLEPHSPPSNASGASNASFRAKRNKPAAVQVERINRSITSYLRKPSKPQSTPAEPQRRARGSRPITPACSPDVSETPPLHNNSKTASQRVRTANPFVDPEPPRRSAPAATGAHPEAPSSTGTSRFFAAKQKSGDRAAPSAAMAATVTVMHTASPSSVVLVPESPLKSEMKYQRQQHDTNEKGGRKAPAEYGSDSEHGDVGNVFSIFRHEGSDGEKSQLPVQHRPCGTRKRPRTLTESKSGTNASGFVYKTKAERREAALEKWGYKPISEAKVARATSPGIVVADVRTATGRPLDIESNRISGSNSSAEMIILRSQGDEHVDTAADLSSLEAFRCSAEFPLEASRRQEFPLEASRRVVLSSTHAVIDDIEHLECFSHRPPSAPLHHLPTTKTRTFPLDSSSTNGSTQLRRPWPGAGVDDDDEDDDDIEDEPICSGVRADDIRYTGGAGERRRSSIEDGIETSDDESDSLRRGGVGRAAVGADMRNSSVDPSCYGASCTRQLDFVIVALVWWTTQFIRVRVVLLEPS